MLAARWASLRDGQQGNRVLLLMASSITWWAGLSSMLEELKGLICNLGLNTEDTVIGREESLVEGPRK